MLEDLLPQPAVSASNPSIQGLRERERERETLEKERQREKETKCPFPFPEELREAFSQVKSMETEFRFILFISYEFMRKTSDFIIFLNRFRRMDSTLPADDTDEAGIHLGIKREENNPICIEEIASTTTGNLSQ